MTYITHKKFAVWFGIIGAMMVYMNGLLEINYYLNLIMFITFSKIGGLFPDIDHQWHAVKEKTVINFILNKLIMLTGGKHRSWQTHSLDIALIFSLLSYFIPKIIYNKGILNIVDMELTYTIFIGFSLGWISHLVSDMLTSEGVRLLCFVKKTRIALVPRKFLWLKFATGEVWESFIFRVIQVINVIIAVIAIILPFKDIILR